MVIELFEKVMTHPVAKNGLVREVLHVQYLYVLTAFLPKPILWRLRDKAKSNIQVASTAQDSAGLEQEFSTQVKTEEVEEALSWIGGTSRMVREGRRQPFDPITFPSSEIPGPAPPSSFVPDMNNPDTVYSMLFTNITEGSSLGVASGTQYNAPDWRAQMTSFFSSPDSHQSESNSRSSDVDTMIEDVWRTILEDPRLTHTGMNEPGLQI